MTKELGTPELAETSDPLEDKILDKEFLTQIRQDQAWSGLVFINPAIHRPTVTFDPRFPGALPTGITPLTQEQNIENQAIIVATGKLLGEVTQRELMGDEWHDISRSFWVELTVDQIKQIAESPSVQAIHPNKQVTS